MQPFKTSESTVAKANSTLQRHNTGTKLLTSRSQSHGKNYSKSMLNYLPQISTCILLKVILLVSSHTRIISKHRREQRQQHRRQYRRQHIENRQQHKIHVVQKTTQETIQERTQMTVQDQIKTTQEKRKHNLKTVIYKMTVKKRYANTMQNKEGECQREECDDRDHGS